jgi:hypothetical protein
MEYRHVVRMGEERWAYRVLVGKPEGKRPLGRPSFSRRTLHHAVSIYTHTYTHVYIATVIL